ncbi:TonB-dependent receptor [uncultured Microscilla sp.]|uniref:TonB-dependent receptor n=1 Tax=uncultured Microscilla sp. TaxID=432653 RepID=UPI002602FC84|nr:TonB-dependent receptor plug domain-containing protein [uncultured Microscilla sp.]
MTSPVSATVISRKMIQQTGATNIAEALRLAPGLWVNQKTNGNYEVYMRGNQTPSGGLLQDMKNGQLMVMINHVPQFDYLFGGVMWEALPVSVNEVDRIEVIRTPSTVFFGTTAVTGVIHIFTQTVQDNDLKVDINTQAGVSLQNIQEGNRDVSSFNNLSLSFGASDKLRFRLSTNYHSVKRSQDPYYLLNEDRYIQSDSLLFYKHDVIETNLNTKLAQERIGTNAYVFYNPSEKVFVTTQLSYQSSQAQTIHSDDTLALAQRSSNMYGVNLNAYVHNFHFNGSFQQGKRDYAIGYDGNHYQINQFLASLNYRLKYKGVLIQPEVGFLRGKSSSIETPDSIRTLTNYYAFFKTDLNPIRNLRIVASVRGDIYEQQKTPYLSYQLSSSYKLGTHFLHGSFTYNEGLPLVRKERQNAHHSLLSGAAPNKNKVAEFGWNARILSKIRASAEVFYTQGEYNYTTFDTVAVSSEEPVPNIFSITQAGASAQVSVWLNKFQVGGFITMQRSGRNLEQLMNNEINGAPQVFGGFQLNYNGLLNRLTANANVYFYGKHDITTQYQTLTIPAKTLLNIKVDYKVWNENSIFFNARNVLNTSTIEHAYADSIAGMYLIGLKISI